MHFAPQTLRRVGLEPSYHESHCISDTFCSLPHFLTIFSTPAFVVLTSFTKTPECVLLQMHHVVLIFALGLPYYCGVRLLMEPIQSFRYMKNLECEGIDQ